MGNTRCARRCPDSSGATVLGGHQQVLDELRPIGRFDRFQGHLVVQQRVWGTQPLPYGVSLAKNPLRIELVTVMGPLFRHESSCRLINLG